MDKERSDSAERAYAQFLVLRASDPEVDFAGFCAQHPEVASELRRLDALRAGEGPHQPPEPSGETHLHTTPPRDEDASHAAVIERLLTHSPRHTRYTLRKEIARGGMGAILQVWDPDLRRNLAMKVMLAKRRRHEPVDAAPDPTTLYRFLEEAQVTGQLEHPAIVPVHELGIDEEGRVYFTMPLVRGSDFRRVIRSVHGQTSADALGDWDLTRAVGILLKVCHAVAFAHSKGVIHRDLKPTNVMVGRFGEVYVMDWGLARVLDREDPYDLRLRPEDLELASQVLTERSLARGETPDSPLETLDGTVVGTPAYMSPEQAQGRQAELGPRSDVYALGAMLYQLLTGQMPYVKAGVAMSPHMVLACLLAGPPASVRALAPDAPGDLAAICEKAMAVEPKDRYESALELARDLEAWLGHRPVAAQPSSPGYLFRLFVERNRVAAAITAAAAILIVAVVGVFIGRLSDEVRSTQAALDQVEKERDDKNFVAGIHAARSLVDEAEELALIPSALEHLDTWLARVDDLLPQASRYRSALEALPAEHPDRMELQRTLAGIEILQATRPRIAGFRATAVTLRQRSLDDEADAWRRAIEAISSSEEYAGLAIAPQEGLVPLERNDWTGLWEFWHVASGERPRPSTQAGSYDLRPEDGIVLVLVPGGGEVLGIDRPSLGLALRSVELDPYFVSKYEVTQAQFGRIAGRDPSVYGPGLSLPAHTRTEFFRQAFTPLNPVEAVSWMDARSYAQKLGLELPTEDQWEYACRGGTDADWWIGSDPTFLETAENLADRSAAWFAGAGFAEWDDGFAVHAPVGSFEPNPLGLFDMLGNVAEWTATAHVEDWAAPGTPKRYLFRGGGWYLRPEYSTAWYRHYDVPTAANQNRGFRVSRLVQE